MDGFTVTTSFARLMRRDSSRVSMRLKKRTRRIEHLRKELVGVVDERNPPDHREKRAGRQGVEVVCIHGGGTQAQDLRETIADCC